MSDRLTPDKPDAQTFPPQHKRRFDRFVRELRDSGIREDGADEIVALCRGFAVMFQCEPFDEEQIRIFSRIEANGSPERERRIAALVGVWKAWLTPTREIDKSAIVRGIVSFDVENAVQFAQRSLEGRGRVGAWLERTIDVFTRDAIRRWLAPTAFILLLVVAFLENPLFRVWSEMLGGLAKPQRSISAADPEGQERIRDAKVAVDLVRRLDASSVTADARNVSELLESVAESERDRFSRFENWMLESTESRIHRDARVWVMRGPKSEVILVGPDSTSYVDTSRAVVTEGYR